MKTSKLSSLRKQGTLRNSRVVATVLLLIIILFSPNPSSLAQSIHQTEYESHKELAKKPSFFANTDYRIVPIRQVKNTSLSHAIFGYLPDWEYTSSRNTLQYDLLTHIAIFDFTVSANGSLTVPSYWPWVDVINSAHEEGVKIIATVVNFTTSQIHSLLSSSVSKQNLFENLAALLKEFDLDGVNIDFENLASADRGSLLNRFMADLTDYLHREVPGSEISFAAPPVNWGGWDLPGLAHSCDYLFIMGYNFYGSWSETSGPSAPLRGGSYNITNTIQQEYGAVLSSQAHKLILGVPYYGDRWKTRTTAAHSQTEEHLGHPRYKTAYEESLLHGLKWHIPSRASWYSYRQNSNNYQVWFETDTSLGLKYDLVLQHNLKGTGMWALGYDGDRPELWDELRNKFTNSSGIEHINTLPDERLHVYPNPVGDVLHFHFSGNSTQAKTARITNLQGRVINRFTISETSNSISTSQLSPGVYFLRIGICCKLFVK